jgi:hypothetical protein
MFNMETVKEELPQVGTTDTKRRRKPRLSEEEIAVKLFGGEPRWVKPTEDNSEQKQLGALLNWYSYNKEKRDAKQFVLGYLKKTKADEKFIADVEDLPEDNFVTTIGWVARILTIGAEGISNTPKSHLDKFLAKIAGAIEQRKASKNKKEEVVVTPKADIQKILEEQFRGYFGEVAGQIDDFIANNFKSQFDLRVWLADNHVKAIQAKKIAEQLEIDVKELTDALNKKDEQLVEGYSHWSEKQLKSVIAFYQTLIVAAWAWYDCAKELGKLTRKPRARKEKTPDQQAAKVKYQRKEETLNLTSVEPKKLVGATQAWVYNTKYRMLGVYNASNERGFFIKGTTIQNFDEHTSVEKKLRKPESVIPKVSDGGKVSLRKLMDTIRCKDKNLTGRINENTIIVKVF